jgi:AcrR family transcriptional regulator
VRWDAFGSLAADLAAVPRTSDAVGDLQALGIAYYEHAVAHPDLYRVMFLEGDFDETDAEVCRGTFDTLVGAVARCIEEGRFAPADPEALATELWAAGHGIVTLQLAGALPPEVAAASARRVAAHLLAAFAG